MLETCDGRLLASPCYVNTESAAHLFRSDDGGRTWAYQARIAAGATECSLYETAGGDLVAFLRCWEEAPSSGGRDIGERRSSRLLHMARSSDGGAMWTAPEPLWTGYPACALRMPSGRVLVAYGYRFDERYGVRARLLSSDCEPLDGEEECIVRDDGAVADLGYPDAVLLEDGRVLLVYYMNVRSDAAGGAAPPRFIAASVIEE